LTAVVALRPDESSYGSVFKFLHWTMFLALGAQFVVGYAMDRGEFLLEWAVERWLGGEEEALLPVHVALGLLILTLALIRVTWRRRAGLPPWAEGLSPAERRLAHATERLLYWLMFLIPLTGLALVLFSGEDWDLRRGEWRAPWDWADDDLLLAGHVATHVVFFGALAAHVGLVLKHQLVDRDGLLRRML
jgi:cytochrome b561